MRVWLLALVILLATTGTALAQSTAKSVDWQRFDTDLVLQPDGSLVVTETQTVNFHGSFQQGFQVISLDRTTGITNVSVAELNSAGQPTPLNATSSSDANGLRITWSFPPITNGTATFVLRYTAHGATRVYPDGDQVDWMALYADRPGPVASSTVTLHLPGDVQQSAIRSALYAVPVGRLPQQVGTATLVDPRTLQFQVGSLPTSTGAEIRAQVPPGLLPQATAPAWQASADRQDWLQQSVAPIANFLVLLLSLAVLAGGGLAVVLLWYSRVREPPVGQVPPILDQPPSDLPAPLAGTLVDGVADLQDAVAILIDLARRGVITLKEEPGPDGSDVRVILHRPTEDPKLERYERVLLVALFGRGVSEGDILLSQARVRFASAIGVLEDRLYDAVVEAGLFTANPKLERRRFRTLATAAIGLGVALAIIPTLVVGWLVPAIGLPGLLLAILGGVVLWLAGRMPRRTERGALEAARWRAFRAHLLREPASTWRGLQDASLAYAVAFGIDREFLQRLESHGVPAPTWYVGQPGPGPIIFVPGGWYGGPGWGGGGPHHAPMPQPTGGAPTVSGPGGPQGWSDALADLLNAASGALGSGGGSGPWSGGGWGGGGGGGGGSGGFS